MMKLTMILPFRCIIICYLCAVINFVSSPINPTFAVASSLLRGGDGESQGGTKRATIDKMDRSLQDNLFPAAIATTNCNVIRSEDYEAELQLLYEYEVEFKKGSSRSLIGIEKAITHAIAKRLDACDSLDRAVYKVKANTRHKFSKTEYCVPQVGGNTCSVVNGATSILLDSNSANVQEEVYTLIGAVLLNPEILASFAPSVARAQYIKSIDNTLVFSPDNSSSDQGHTTPSSVTATIAVAAASVSFVVASIFCYGLLRRDMRKHPEPSIRHKNHRLNSKGTSNFRGSNGQILVGNPPMGIRSRPAHAFVRLEDFAISPAGHTSVLTTSSIGQDGEENDSYTPSITWSISDITSDSASIRSNLSRRTSNLERIEEESEESDDTPTYESSSEHEYDDGGCDADQSSTESAPPLSRMYGYVGSPIKYTAENYFQGIRPDFEELQGCLFVDDDVDVRHSPILPSIHVMPDVDDDDDDLQVSLDSVDDAEYEVARGIHLPSLLGPNVGTTDDESLRLERCIKEGPKTSVPSVPDGEDNDKEGSSREKSVEEFHAAERIVGANVSQVEQNIVPDDPEPEDDDASEDTTMAVADGEEDDEEENVLLPTQGENHISIPNNPRAITGSSIVSPREFDPEVVPIENPDDSNVATTSDGTTSPIHDQEKDLAAPVETPKEKSALVSDAEDTDDERPWIGIAHGEAIVVIESEDYYDEYLSSECPETPCSEGGYDTTTSCFETPREYEESIDRDEI